MGKWYVDYRFIVEDAKDAADVIEKAEALIHESTAEVWYTRIRVVSITEFEAELKAKGLIGVDEKIEPPRRPDP